MPQIDNLTFFNQVLNSTIFFLSFFFFLFIYLLPQYIVKFYTLKILWTFLNTFLTKIKLYSILCLIHRVIFDNKINLFANLFFKLSFFTALNASKFFKFNIHKNYIFMYIACKRYLFLNNVTKFNFSSNSIYKKFL